VLKKIRVSFTLDGDMFAAILTKAGKVDIDLIGDEPKPVRNGARTPKMLQAPGGVMVALPKPRAGKPATAETALAAIKAAGDIGCAPIEIKKALAAAGLSEHSHATAIDQLMKLHLVRRIGRHKATRYVAVPERG
jgi:hypothetical protein